MLTAELTTLKCLVDAVGIEPTNVWLKARCLSRSAWRPLIWYRIRESNSSSLLEGQATSPEVQCDIVWCRKLESNQCFRPQKGRCPSIRRLRRCLILRQMSFDVRLQGDNRKRITLWLRDGQRKLAGALGIKPKLKESKSLVLSLHYTPIVHGWSGENRTPTKGFGDPCATTTPQTNRYFQSVVFLWHHILSEFRWYHNNTLKIHLQLFARLIWLFAGNVQTYPSLYRARQSEEYSTESLRYRRYFYSAIPDADVTSKRKGSVLSKGPWFVVWKKRLAYFPPLNQGHIINIHLTAFKAHGVTMAVLPLLIRLIWAFNEVHDASFEFGNQCSNIAAMM